MPHASPIAVAMPATAPIPFVDIATARDNAAAVATSDAMRGLATYEKHAAALLTPPDSVSPDLHAVADDDDDQAPASMGMPLSKGALSGLDAAAAITPAMLARDHLPGIMLGNGPRAIRYIMGELTQSLPGFSRIPSAKARRLVVAALESRHGGGRDGNITFYKTGWGKWDAHVKGSSRDSAIGSFNDARFSPPRSERSFAMSHTDSAVHMPGPRLPSGYRDPLSGESWTASSIREEDELNMDMDVPENEADKMSLDGMSEDDDEDGSEDMEDDATDDEEDWAAVGPEALRKASVAVPGAPRRNYNALSSSYSARWPSRNWNRRQSGTGDRTQQAMSLPYGNQFRSMDPAFATPEEKAAVVALMSMGSM